MSLKKKIKVGYSDIKIDLVKEIPDKNQHVFGEYDPVSQKILLDKNQSERSLANSFLHELVHAVVDNSGLNSDGNCLSSTKDEELTVNAIANQLSQVIRDNKWFLPYLQKYINLNEKTGVKVLSGIKKSVAKRAFSKNRNKHRSRNSRR